MNFSSLDFYLFFTIFCALYFFCSRTSYKLQNIVTLIFSYLFYCYWDWRFLILVIISTISDYVIGQKISTSMNKNKWMFGSFIINFSILGFFKYFNFFIEALLDVSRVLNIESNLNSLYIILPIGISFYTFQSFSYVVDVKNKKLEPERDLIVFACYVAFFPQLIAGPIERSKNILHQFRKVRVLNSYQISSGFSLIVLGLIKKIVFSDRLAVIVDQIFDSGISGLDYMTFNSASLFLGALAFSFQIYLDFSAYTDIARGLGKILGINLIQNFNHPYRASSFKDFWRRWHISLSTWFRDYVFIPLGGSRRSFSRTQINILIVFTISGLWHGANYNFILWGILHGIMLCFENTFNNFIKNYRAIWRIVTQLLIILLWIFFRSEGPLQAVFIISKILLPTTGGVNILSTWNLALILISFLFIHYESYLRKFAKTKIVLIDRYPIFSGILYSFVISSIFILKEVTNDFVYFQF